MKKIVKGILTLTLVSLVGISLANSGAVMAAENPAVSEQVNNTDQSDFSDMIVGYTVDGVPIVVDPNPISTRALENKATVISPYGYFYTSSDLSPQSLLFAIPRGTKVVVVSSNVGNGVACIRHAGRIGYIRMNNLRFGE